MNDNPIIEFAATVYAVGWLFLLALALICIGGFGLWLLREEHRNRRRNRR